MLYQPLTLTYPAPYNQFALPPGVLGLVQLSVNQGDDFRLVMHQVFPDTVHLKQDSSLRGWISTVPGGNPIQNSMNFTEWHLTTLQKRIIGVYDNNIGQEEPYDFPSFGLSPGIYWLNILNLVNESNAFFLEIVTGDHNAVCP